jgi:catechol 2,3-dioxygenase-like lactoylglutathione lyase family enzyme
MSGHNVEQAVPFLMVTGMERSLRFYVDAVGFTVTKTWAPEGKIRWCWLELGGAGLMLQEYGPGRAPQGKLGEGMSICFQCKDALELYHGFRARGLVPRRPFVGNAMWVVCFTDPDGYKLDFESPTDAPEESEYESSQPQIHAANG